MQRDKYASTAAGEVIVAQGEPLPGVYLFIAGQAEETVRDDAGKSTRLRTLCVGDIAGQTATALAFYRLFTARLETQRAAAGT